MAIENGLITTAIVPSIGGRVMKYDLGEHQSMFINEPNLGKVYPPDSGNPWDVAGGYGAWG